MPQPTHSSLPPQKITLLLRPLQSAISSYTRLLSVRLPSINQTTTHLTTKRKRKRNQASEDEDWGEPKKKRRRKGEVKGTVKVKGQGNSKGQVSNLKKREAEVDSRAKPVLTALKTILDHLSSSSIPSTSSHRSFARLSTCALHLVPSLILSAHATSETTSDCDSTWQRGLDIEPFISRVPWYLHAELVVGIAVEMVLLASVDQGNGKVKVRRIGRAQWVGVLRAVLAMVIGKWEYQARKILSHLLSYPLIRDPDNPCSPRISIFAYFPTFLISLRSLFPSDHTHDFSSTILTTCSTMSELKVAPIVISLLDDFPRLALRLPFPLPKSMLHSIVEGLSDYPEYAVQWVFENPESDGLRSVALHWAVREKDLQSFCDLWGMGEDVKEAFMSLQDEERREVEEILERRGWGPSHQLLESSSPVRSYKVHTDDTKSIDNEEQDEEAYHFGFKISQMQNKKWRVVGSEEEDNRALVIFSQDSKHKDELLKADEEEDEIDLEDEEDIVFRHTRSPTKSINCMVVHSEPESENENEEDGENYDARVDSELDKILHADDEEEEETCSEYEPQESSGFRSESSSSSSISQSQLEGQRDPGRQKNKPQSSRFNRDTKRVRSSNVLNSRIPPNAQRQRQNKMRQRSGGKGGKRTSISMSSEPDVLDLIGTKTSLVVVAKGNRSVASRRPHFTSEDELSFR